MTSKSEPTGTAPGLSPAFEAARLLRQLDEEELKKSIWHRLHGQSFPGLPGLTSDSSASDILADALHVGDAQFANRLRATVSRLLQDASESSDPDPEYMCGLLYLAARISATEAIVPVTFIAGNFGDDVSPNPVHLESLRCLLALLAVSPQQAGRWQADVFSAHLQHASCTIPALTGLIGLRLSTPAELRKLTGKVDEDDLQFSLRFCGFSDASARLSAGSHAD